MPPISAPSERGPSAHPSLGVVVPALDAAATIDACLAGLVEAGVAPEAIVVVDDGSRDATAALARAREARVVATTGRTGAARARNLGATMALGELILFVDADVRVAPDAVRRVLDAFVAAPALAAVFGSYDDTPPAPGLVSRVRNLLHHHVHQEGGGLSASFWTGLGAVRREVFDAVGGFAPDQRMMEDVRFGRALWSEGHRIELRPDIQGAHLKRWTFGSMLKTDLLDRAIPWSRMLLDARTPNPPAALNVAATGRLSVAAVAVSLLAVPLLIAASSAGASVAAGAAATTLLAALAALTWANRRFLLLVGRRLGRAEILPAVGILWSHYAAGGLGFAWVLAERLAGWKPTATRRRR